MTAILELLCGIYWRDRFGGVMRHISFIVSISVLIMCVAVWAGELRLVASSLVPAATAKVSYEHDRNGNVTFTISTKHLDAPERLTPAKNSYVVWIRPTDGQPQNAGALRINNELEGSFSTTTPAPAFDIVITAEDNPKTMQPTGPEIMHGSIQTR
jgi:hypothetical protein